MIIKNNEIIKKQEIEIQKHKFKVDTTQHMLQLQKQRYEDEFKAHNEVVKTLEEKCKMLQTSIIEVCLIDNLLNNSLKIILRQNLFKLNLLKNY